MMKRAGLLVSSVGFCLLAGSLASAQGWSAAPRSSVEASEQDTPQEAPKDKNGQSLGWVNLREAVDPATLDRPMTELERLSQSPSGAGFSADFYDAKSDNPLIPVSVVLRALDKITAQYTDLDVKIGDVQDFGALQILPRTCDKRPPEEVPETTAFLEVFENSPKLEAVSEASDGAALDGAADADPEIAQDLAANPKIQEIVSSDVSADVIVSTDETIEGVSVRAAGPEGENLFRGWMFASSPALNALEHPVYDVWVIDCKMVEPDNS